MKKKQKPKDKGWIVKISPDGSPHIILFSFKVVAPDFSLAFSKVKSTVAKVDWGVELKGKLRWKLYEIVGNMGIGTYPSPIIIDK